jgi:hypothetical protein
VNSIRHHFNRLQQVALLFRRVMSSSELFEPITSDSESADDKTQPINQQNRIII